MKTTAAAKAATARPAAARRNRGGTDRATTVSAPASKPRAPLREVVTTSPASMTTMATAQAGVR